MRIIVPYHLFLACFITCCNPKNNAQISPPAYDLSKPEKFSMPESILEVSGICFYKGNSDTVYVVQDEDGKVYRLAWGEKKTFRTKFARQGDFEDITIINDKIFVLKSNGTLFEFPVKDAGLAKPDNVKEYKKLLPPGEYESMYGDEESGNIYILCKNCPGDNGKKFVSGFVVQLTDPPSYKEGFEIKVSSIKKLSGKVKRAFSPSAMAKNPVTNDWFIVSAVNHLLVVADSSWTIKEVYPLNGNIFNQPEGIAFDSSGNLFISNEGDELSMSNILKFKRLK